MRRFLSDESTLQAAGMSERGLLLPLHAEATPHAWLRTTNQSLTRFMAYTILITPAGEMPRNTEKFCLGGRELVKTTMTRKELRKSH